MGWEAGLGVAGFTIADSASWVQSGYTSICCIVADTASWYATAAKREKPSALTGIDVAASGWQGGMGGASLQSWRCFYRQQSGVRVHSQRQRGPWETRGDRPDITARDHTATPHPTQGGITASIATQSAGVRRNGSRGHRKCERNYPASFKERSRQSATMDCESVATEILMKLLDCVVL